MNTNVRDGPSYTSKLKNDIKNTINTNEMLLNFLKEKKIYGRYIKNITKNIICRPYLVNSVLNSIRYNRDPINCGFTWETTSEGHKFWYNYNNTYKEIKNKNN